MLYKNRTAFLQIKFTGLWLYCTLNYFFNLSTNLKYFQIPAPLTHKLIFVVLLFPSTNSGFNLFFFFQIYMLL